MSGGFSTGGLLQEVPHLSSTRKLLSFQSSPFPPETIKPWVQTNLAFPKWKDCLEIKWPGTASQRRGNTPRPLSELLWNARLSPFLWASLGFQATFVLCSRPSLTSDSEGKLSPRQMGISMHYRKHGFFQGHWLVPASWRWPFQRSMASTSPLPKNKMNPEATIGAKYQWLRDEKLTTFPSFHSGSAVKALS